MGSSYFYLIIDITNIGKNYYLFMYITFMGNNEKESHRSVHMAILLYDALIPLISEELNPRCSISFNPAIVQPLGVVTLSISSSGCRFPLSTNSPAPISAF